MINLLPTDIKEQIAYAKRNAILMRYIWLAVIVFMALAAIFASSNWYLGKRISEAESRTKDKQAQLLSYTGLQSKVKLANQRISSLKALQTNQAKLSAVLKELAAHTPAGAYITNITLTGDDSKPVGIVATANSYNDAVALRDALASSPRVSEVDIATVSQVSGKFNIQLNLGFKPGQAK
ncbi:MAG TPA: PilN domain-containing protein [Candidatus Nanoarchaeia archaeon]|nr:PilN domain-containing protein [Candidatus Nanoarchaeia archaeon]